MEERDRQKVETLNLNEIRQAIKAALKDKGFVVSEDVGVSDLVAVLNAGFFTVRVGILLAIGDDVFKAVGKAVMAREDEMLDKVIVVVDDGEGKVGVSGVEVVPLHKVLGSAKLVTLAAAGFREYYFDPAVGKGEVERLAEKHRGRLLKRGDFMGARTVYLPLYCFSTLLHTVDYAPEAIEASGETLCFDAVTGTLITYDKGLAPVEAWNGIGEISDEAVDILARIADLGEASLAELKEEFSGRIDVDAVIDVLLEKGLIEPVADDGYAVARPPVSGYRSPLRAVENVMKQGKPGCGHILESHVPHAKMERIIKSYGIVREAAVLYYPLHTLVYSRGKGIRRIEVAVIIDGMSGERLAELEEMLAQSPAVVELDAIIDNVLKGNGIEVCGG